MIISERLNIIDKINGFKPPEVKRTRYYRDLPNNCCVLGQITRALETGICL
jgi:hypothetical protein